MSLTQGEMLTPNPELTHQISHTFIYPIVYRNIHTHTCFYNADVSLSHHYFHLAATHL